MSEEAADAAPSRGASAGSTVVTGSVVRVYIAGGDPPMIGIVEDNSATGRALVRVVAPAMRTGGPCISVLPEHLWCVPAALVTPAGQRLVLSMSAVLRAMCNMRDAPPRRDAAKEKMRLRSACDALHANGAQELALIADAPLKRVLTQAVAGLRRRAEDLIVSTGAAGPTAP